MELEGRILKVIKRDLNNIVGTIIKENNNLKFKVDDLKLSTLKNIDIELVSQDFKCIF